MVELQPSKLIAWVRFPSPADYTQAHIAQSVEHFLGKEEVTGSNPVVGFLLEMMTGEVLRRNLLVFVKKSSYHLRLWFSIPKFWYEER